MASMRNRLADEKLPKGVPFLGGHAVDAWPQIGLPPSPGIDLVVLTETLVDPLGRETPPLELVAAPA